MKELGVEYDWRAELNYEDRDMLAELDELIREEPVLWMVLIKGPTTPRAIATQLTMPMDVVLAELRALKADGSVVDRENAKPGQPMVWEVTSRHADIYNWRKGILKNWNGNR